MVIRTDIKTHTELLAYLVKTLTTVELNDQIPWSLGKVGASGDENKLPSNTLFMFLWKRYSISRHRHSVQDTSMPPRKQLLHTLTTDDNNTPTAALTWKLLQAYLYCQHLHHLSIHVPSFLNLFVRPPSDVMHSPAVLALCAIACATTCHHMAPILPHARATTFYADFYFSQARILVMDRFDDISLETFTTYVLLAFYELLMQRPESSHYYGELAERMGILLVDEDDELHHAQQVLFDRLKLQLIKVVSPHHHTRHRLFVVGQRHRRDKNPLSDRQRLRSGPSMDDYQTKAALMYPVDDDSPRETRHIQLSTYITTLHKSCHHVVYHGPSYTDANYLGVLTHMFEMLLRQWYVGLPASYRLDTRVTEVFFARSTYSPWLPTTKTLDAVPLLTTLTLLNEYMMMAKTHLCDTPEDLETRHQVAAQWQLSNGDLDVDDVGARWGQQWRSRMAKLKDLCQNDVEAVASLLDSGYVGFDSAVGRTVLTVALCTVTLLQYLARHHPCQYDQRVALNAWDVLLRAARFGYGDQDEIQVHLLCCLALVRDEHRKCSRFSMSTTNYVNSLEKEYDSCFGNSVV